MRFLCVVEARRAAHERAENVSPAGLEDAASHGPEVDTSGIDLPPSGLNPHCMRSVRIVCGQLDNARELERLRVAIVNR
jgi:hypothetical protein